LVQIQNYIKNRRMLVGGNNNIDELEKYLKQCQQHEGMEEKDLFVFGENLGDGSKNSHLFESFIETYICKHLVAACMNDDETD